MYGSLAPGRGGSSGLGRVPREGDEHDDHRAPHRRRGCPRPGSGDREESPATGGHDQANPRMDSGALGTRPTGRGGQPRPSARGGTNRVNNLPPGTAERSASTEFDGTRLEPMASRILSGQPGHAATVSADAGRADEPTGPSTPIGVEEDAVARRDRILVERARDGDLDAFNELVLAYQDQLWALVARLVPDPDQASDAVQEAFFSAYRNLHSFRGGSVRSWLSRIAINAAMDLQRARRRRPASPYPELDDETWQPPAGPAADPEATALAAERSRVLADALARIGPDQRTAIVLFDVEGYDYAQIAELTGVSLGTVKSRIHRGRLALRQLLEGRLDLFRGDR